MVFWIGGARGRDSAYKRGGVSVGMLVVSLRGDFGLTYGVLGKTPSYLAVKVSFRVAREKI